jgi:hypothetical protein
VDATTKFGRVESDIADGERHGRRQVGPGVRSAAAGARRSRSRPRERPDPRRQRAATPAPGAADE